MQAPLAPGPSPARGEGSRNFLGSVYLFSPPSCPILHSPVSPYGRGAGGEGSLASTDTLIECVVEKKDLIVRGGQRQGRAAAGQHFELAADSLRGGVGRDADGNGQMSRLRPSDWHQGP